MKKQLISTLIATTLMASTFTTSVHADSVQSSDHQQQSSYSVAEDEQLIGLGSGAAMGAVIGGPAGFVVGAIVGGIIGTAVGQDSYIQAQDEEMSSLTSRNAELERISAEYNDSQMELARLQQEVIQARIAEREQEARQIDLGLEMNVHFRTGSAVIEPLFMAQLDELAELMKQAPEVSWELSGYADRRGDSMKNYELSKRRVEAVRTYLEQHGVDPEQVLASAFGDQEPLKAEQSFEGDFFDRRVTLRSTQMAVQTANAN
ncbi:sortase-associated OmpA-like protein PdsO [Photobacterium atrarenae]|uniref:Sortase-associated OmpA-like protein PdsO n=1 Tax=Photobacterium atrarenae TaxID=865757 RepID=A0ABY5GLE1_9GAMM|nr:sortase-associated OmpA-like protein PdsO [Photobacterium atrarenae]UTV29925.1 sortase-associated OmpA-like protein PdsO [Photobacterium atrarenae]